MLAWQLHVLALLTTAGERSAETVAGQAKLSPYVVKRTAGLARRLSRQRVAALSDGLSELDVRLKRQPLDADEALKNYLLRLA
jgi:DNA polymerase III delta subunit